MAFNRSIPFFTLLVLVYFFKEILPIQPANTQTISSEYNITALLNKWFAKVLTFDAETPTMEMIKTMKVYTLNKFEYNASSSESVYVIESKFVANRAVKTFNPIVYLDKTSILRLVLENLVLTLRGIMNVKKTSDFLPFHSYIHFKNITISETEPLSPGENQQINISCDGYKAEFESTLAKPQYLAEKLKPLLPALLCKNLNSNEKFSQEFDSIYDYFRPPRYPDFSQHPEKYYYSICQIGYSLFNLKNIVINHLWNFEVVKIHKKPMRIFTHTLKINDVRGSMILDYGIANKTPLGLSFAADYLVISMKGTDCMRVEVPYYHVDRDDGVSLTYRQSSAIMHKIESALARALFPSARVWKLCEIQTPLDKIAISNVSDWKTIKEMYHEWVPFNE